MSTRPTLTAAVGIVAAATILVGGAGLASYAANGHGSGGASASASSQPKTITFTLGTNGQRFAGVRLFTAKVPKGSYSVAESGFMEDTSSTSTSDNYTCLLTDKKTLLKVLKGSGNFTGAQRLYSITGDSEADSQFSFGLLDDFNPVAKVDRPNVLYGCIFNGGPFQIVRPLKFTLTPVKPSNQKGKKFTLPTAKARQLAHALR